LQPGESIRSIEQYKYVPFLIYSYKAQQKLQYKNRYAITPEFNHLCLWH